MSDENIETPQQPSGSYVMGKDGERIPLAEWEAKAAASPLPGPKPETPASKVILQRWATPEENLAVDFDRHADRLLPGAAPILAKFMASQYGAMSPDRRASAVVKYLDSPIAQRWLDPEAKAPALEGGETPSPLRQVLMRYAPELRPGSVDALVREWSVGLAHLLDKPAQLTGEVVRRLGKPENAAYLSSPIDKIYAHAFGQARPAPAAKAEPARQADGRFQQPPAEKPKRTPSTF